MTEASLVFAYRIPKAADTKRENWFTVAIAKPLISQFHGRYAVANKSSVQRFVRFIRINILGVIHN